MEKSCLVCIYIALEPEGEREMIFGQPNLTATCILGTWKFRPHQDDPQLFEGLTHLAETCEHFSIRKEEKKTRAHNRIE